MLFGAGVIRVEGKPLATCRCAVERREADGVFALEMTADVRERDWSHAPRIRTAVRICRQEIAVLKVEVLSIDEPEVVLRDHQRRNLHFHEQECRRCDVCGGGEHCAHITPPNGIG